MTSPTISAETIDQEQEWLLARDENYVELINDTRNRLEVHFPNAVTKTTSGDFREQVEAVFSNPDQALNVATLMQLTKELDVVVDHPGFVVDELLGVKLATTIAGGEPAATLAQSTFHFIDIWHDRPDAPVGRDDFDAGIAAGFQTRLPGWKWQSQPNPFITDDPSTNG